MQLEPHLGDLEAEYRLHHFAKDRGSVLVAALTWLLFTLYFIRTDYLLFGVNPPFALLVIGKSVYGLSTLLMLGTIFRLTQPRHLDWLVFTWGTLSASFIYWHQFSRPRTYVGHYAIDVLIIVSLYVVPNRLALRLTPALFFSCLYLAGLLSNASLPPLDRDALVVACLLANILGFVTSTRLFTYRREQFRAVVEERRAKDALAILALTDALTGVLNRRAFNQRGVEAFRHWRRYQHPFSVQVIDLDFFKQINDTYGHEAGDETLKQFAQLVLAHKRETDVFGRIGGEEFGLILPDTTAAAARTLGDRLREVTQATPIRIAQTQLAITLSMGVAEVQAGDTDFDMLVVRADRLLYQAKRQGRNRVEGLLTGEVLDREQSGG